MQNSACARCKCSPEICSRVIIKCKNCVVKNCCCMPIHTSQFKILKNFSCIPQIFQNIKRVFIATLGIEILCIISAEIGENIGLSVFGFSLLGIVIAYFLGFAIAGFSTFMTILGRWDFDNNGNIKKAQSCCTFLEGNSNKGFLFNFKFTFLSFGKGLSQFIQHRNNPQMKSILKTSIIILITAESACILTAETVTLIFYPYSMFLAIPLALLVGTFTLTLVESIRKNSTTDPDCGCENFDKQDISSSSSSFTRSKFLPPSEFRRLKKEP
jgi:hypothetical protein